MTPDHNGVIVSRKSADRKHENPGENGSKPEINMCRAVVTRRAGITADHRRCWRKQAASNCCRVAQIPAGSFDYDLATTSISRPEGLTTRCALPVMTTVLKYGGNN